VESLTAPLQFLGELPRLQVERKALLREHLAEEEAELEQ
jgi:hypothetical protein